MNPSSYHSAGSRIAAPLLAATFCSIVLAGCIIIPVDYHATGSRHNVTSESTNALCIGVTTREDVLLTLGEPDFVSEDSRRFGYLWTKVKAIWAVASYGGSGAGGEITQSYLIETSFDPCNRVSNVRLLKKWGDSVTGSPEAETSRR
jgi:hypothetical protein